MYALSLGFPVDAVC